MKWLDWTEGKKEEEETKGENIPRENMSHECYCKESRGIKWSIFNLDKYDMNND